MQASVVDGEALRHRHTGCSHLSQTSALAAQNVLHGDLVAAKGIVAFAEVVPDTFLLMRVYLPNDGPRRDAPAVLSMLCLVIR